MRTVHELTQEELEELQQTYFEQLEDIGELEDEQDITMPTDIPIENVKAHYEGFYFTDDDFFCNQTEEQDLSKSK